MEFGTIDWVLENERRSAYMEKLMEMDGRNDPSHPMYRLFTGLLEERAKTLLEMDRDRCLSGYR